MDETLLTRLVPLRVDDDLVPTVAWKKDGEQWVCQVAFEWENQDPGYGPLGRVQHVPVGVRRSASPAIWLESHRPMPEVGETKLTEATP